MKPILDISEFQAGINYEVVAKQIDGVIIRCGGTGYGDSHTVYDDSRFEQHYKGFHDQGVPIGVYFYAGAVTAEGVDAEIRLCQVMLAGKKIDLPVYYDVECTQGDYYSLSVESRTQLALRWMRGIEALGYKAGLYTYLFYRTLLRMNAFDGFPIWMAQYYSQLEYDGRCELWQYTSDGVLDGYVGRLDLSKVMDEEWWQTMEVAVDPDPEPEEEEEDEVTVTVPVLRIGDESNAVIALQGILMAHGYDLEWCGGADGIFGDGTEAAVKEYQRYNGLDVDGIVGVQTWGELLDS